MPYARPGLVIGAQIAILACGPTGPTTLTKVPNGVWGGDHAGLTVSDTSAAIEFDCAHGTLDEPPAVDRNGSFEVSGIFVREHGGPIRVDEVPDEQPARYAGTTNGRTMSLTVTLTTSSQPLGPFALALGQPGRLVKCL